MSNKKYHRSKQKLSVLLVICMVLFHLPVSRTYAAPDPRPESGSVYVNGVNLLEADEADYPDGISYRYESNVNVITVSGAAITYGHPEGGKDCGIFANGAGDLELVLVGDNSINIPNYEDPEADPPMINGVGIFVRQGNLTISGSGTLNIDTGDRAIILDSNGATEPLDITFKDSVIVTANKSIFTEGGESRPNVYIDDTAEVTSHGIECGNGNTPYIAAGASFSNIGGGGDPGPGSEGLYVNGVDILDEGADEPEGVSYEYDEANSRHKIILNGATIDSGHADGGRYSGISVRDAGVEIVLNGDNTINMPNQTEPAMEGTGIFVSKGTLIFSGTGSLTINSGGRSIHLDAQDEGGKALIFNGSVTIEANNRIFTEGNDRPSVFINYSASVTSHGIECGGDNNPIVDTENGASFTNTDIGGGDPGGDPVPGTESLYVNGVDILSEDYDDDVEGLAYNYDSETDTHIITLDGVNITTGAISPGTQAGIHAHSIGNIEIILVGDNSINIPNYEDPEADPPMINGVGLIVRQGNLTISGSGTLNIDTGDRAIILDANGATEPLDITFKDSVIVTANKSIFTEGGEGRPNVYIDDTAEITSHGIECGNDNTPTVAEGASYTNTDTGGGDPSYPDTPFNLSVGGVELVIDGEVQEESIPNLEIIYYDHVDQYSLYLNGGTFDGIYTEGFGRFGIYAEEDSTVNNLALPGYEDYSIVLSAGAEITPYDFLKERDPSIIYHWDNTLTLTGGILSSNHLAFKDDITVNIGSPDVRANKGIVGDPFLRVEAVNTQSVNIWANTVGIENVNSDTGFELGSSVDVSINSNGIGATDTGFLVGEGSTLNMVYGDKGNFEAAIYKWDYMNMTGPIETYANMPYTIVDELLQGSNPENKYNLNETATTYQLISTAKPLYTVGYNYDNDRDGMVDNPEEEIINGQLSIKGATGTCQTDSEGFVDYNFEAGTIVTIELLPDYGYQYEAGTLRYNLMDQIDTSPGETRAYYTFIMPENHIHLYAGFIESNDIIQNSTPAITDAVVDIGLNNIHGNVAFEIAAESPSTEEAEAISELAGTKVAGAYLDLGLNEYIAKAGTEDAWITELSELENPVTINLELSNNLLGKSEYSVARIHNGEATVLETSYNNGVVSFDTDRFSTYAILYNNTAGTPVYTPPVEAAPVVTPTIIPTITPTPTMPSFNLEITSPDSDAEGPEGKSTVLSSDILERAIEAGENLTVTVKNKENKELYTWTFNTRDNKSISGNKVTDVNLTLDVLPLSNYDKAKEALSDNQGLVLSFEHNGSLPAAAQVRVYVGDMEGIEPGSQIYLYHYNKETGKLDTLPYSSRYKVDKDGFITVSLVHCSDYVVLKDEAQAGQITSLRNQIEVTAEVNALYIGGTREDTTGIKLKLPLTLERVQDLKEETSSDAVGGVVVTYSSSNNKVATVDKEGMIRAVGVGKAEITTKLSLYSGKVKTIKTKIEVKEAYIEIRFAKSDMKVDDTYTFRAKAYGYYSRDIQWMTDDEAIIEINATTGKAVAKAKGICYIIAKTNEATKRIKVTVR